jgi:hypothetical protein
MASKKRRKVVDASIRERQRKDRIHLSRKVRLEQKRAAEKEREQ